MIIRYLSSAGIGIVVTTTLLWSMNALIDMGETAQTPSVPHRFPDWIRTDIETPVQESVKPPDRVTEPAPLPEQRPPAEAGGETIPVAFPAPPIEPGGPDFRSGLPGNVDSGLINIINAQPDYPVGASQKGLEGYVIVQFDVTGLGTVENVRVIETSNSIFNKAAVKAAYRSKYKPKTVDGVSYGTEGLRKLFRFEMKES